MTARAATRRKAKTAAPRKPGRTAAAKKAAIRAAWRPAAVVGAGAIIEAAHVTPVPFGWVADGRRDSPARP